MKYIPGILVFAVLSVVLLACTETPIFYTLEKAYKTSDDRGLDDTAVVQRIVYTTGAPTERYFVLAQSLFQRDPGASTTWQRVTPPADGALCGGLEYFSITGEIIAWFYNSTDLKPLGLYSRDPSSSASASWTGPITDSDWTTGITWPDQQFRIHFIKAVNGLLFVSTAVYDSVAGTTTYNLYYSATAASNSFAACFGADLNSQILDVEHDGTDYWLITTPETGTPPTFLYTGGTPTIFAEDATRPDFSSVGDDPSGTIYAPHSLYFAAGRLYLSGWQGRIFFRPLAGPWSAWSGGPEIVEVRNKNNSVPFTGFVETGKNNEFFVGSFKYGYYSFSNLVLDPVSTADLSRQPAPPLYEYPPNELVNGAILSFLAPADAENADTIFACTSGAGLWRGDWDGIKWVWRQE